MSEFQEFLPIVVLLFFASVFLEMTAYCFSLYEYLCTSPIPRLFAKRKYTTGINIDFVFLDAATRKLAKAFGVGE
jgi:hypothetical protein